MLDESSSLVKKLQDNTKQFRGALNSAGFRIMGHNECPIAPVWLGDARIATEMSNRLMEEHNIFVIGFSFPVVPKNEARIRVQLSAAHSE